MFDLKLHNCNHAKLLSFFNIFRGEKEANYDEIVETLEKKLSNSAVENQAKGEEVSSELLRNVENERDSLKNEFDQVSFVKKKKKKLSNTLCCISLSSLAYL